jgi:DNA polymerase III subunit beta
MKISLPRQDLVAALNIVKAAATNKASIPILANVYLRADAKSKKLELTCTDMDIMVRTVIPADVEEKGECTVRAATLLGIVATFTGPEPVTLEALTHDLKIECGSARYKLGMLGSKEFPDDPKLKESRAFIVPQHQLRSLLDATAFCMSTDESRYVLNGSLVRFNGSLTAVATNGRCLAAEEVPWEGTVKDATDLVLPARTVAQLMSLLDAKAPDEGAPPQVTINLSASHAQFVIGETTVFSKLIEGNYPNYQQVIPKELGIAIPISRTDLLAVLKRVNLIHDSCKLEFEGQTLTIRARGKREIPGDAVETLFIPKTEEREIHFNTQYLIDALNAVESDEVLFHVTESTMPAVIKVPARNWLCVIMPMRIGDAPEKEKPAAKGEEKSPEPAKA